jgi:molybdopterin/thiamine biosynthesis adenylyltransferase
VNGVPRSVLIVGAGGLGCPAALALAQAGVRRITLADPDRVDLSNLHRQLWHGAADVGRPKVLSAAEKLRASFPGLDVCPLEAAVDADNAPSLFGSHALVIDGTDGAGTKFLLSDTSVTTGVPLIYGGAIGLRGLAMRIDPAAGGPCLRCLFEGPPVEGPTCAGAGVLGSLPGVVGGLQALLALGSVAGRLFVVEGATMTQRIIQVERSPDCLCSQRASRMQELLA